MRQLQVYLSPEAEHLLDWFHVTMRLTVLKQMARGLPQNHRFADEDEDEERLPAGAHLLLQVRTRGVNGEWEDAFRDWYPGFRAAA